MAAGDMFGGNATVGIGTAMPVICMLAVRHRYRGEERRGSACLCRGNADRVRLPVCLHVSLEYRRRGACCFTAPVVEADAGDDVHYLRPVLLLAARNVEGR